MPVAGVVDGMRTTGSAGACGWRRTDPAIPVVEEAPVVLAGGEHQLKSMDFSARWLTERTAVTRRESGGCSGLRVAALR